MPSKTMKAIKIVEAGKAEIQDVPLPELKEGWILVKPTYVATNPTDWKHIDWMPCPGATVGCDFAGTVEEVAPLSIGNFKKGDRVAGVVHGANAYNYDDGAFGGYLVAKSGGVFHIPDNVKDEEAATLGVGIVTVGQALYQSLHLPLPGSISTEVPVLVYGGSSATGSLAIQFAKLSGATVIATCSSKNFDFVKSLGAVEAFDYNDPECAEKIREYTSDKLHSAMDCIGGESSAAIISAAISSAGGQIASIAPRTKYTRDDVRVKNVLAYSGIGEGYHFMGTDFPAIIEDYDFVCMFTRLSAKLLAEGRIKVHPPRVGEGLDGVLEGLDEMRKGKVSGVKLVYKL